MHVVHCHLKRPCRSAVHVEGGLDLSRGSLSGVNTVFGVKDSQNNTVTVAIRDPSTVQGV